MNKLFTGLGRSVQEKTVPLVWCKAELTPDRGHSFFLYGPPGRQNNIYVFHQDTSLPTKFYL